MCDGIENDPARYKFGSANMADAALLFCTKRAAACWLADVTADWALLVPLTAADTAVVKAAVEVGGTVLEVVAAVVVVAPVVTELSDVGVDSAEGRRLAAPPPLISKEDVAPARLMVRNLSFSCTLDLSLNCGPNSLSTRMSDHTFRWPLYFLTPSNKARSSVAEKGRYLR